MKIILSRKGIDDKYGSGYSLIYPDGAMMSIPIPDVADGGYPYKNLCWKYTSYMDEITSLGLRIKGGPNCHLDPDLIASVKPRRSGWKGCFGQAAAAQSHLINEGVSKGDVFLFFGSFRELYRDESGALGVEPQHTKHVLFGYLQIGEIYTNEAIQERLSSGAFHDHPHVVHAYTPQNGVYIAADTFMDTGLPGWGTFNYSPALDLTKPGYKKSHWELPLDFHYDHGTVISRHANHDRYRKHNDKLILHTVGLGQDFVVSGNKNVVKWASEIISGHVGID